MIIKLGIIGFGGMGKWHAQNAPRAGVEIAAVCDIAEEKQKEAIEMGYRLYTNADELLADPEVNTVILTGSQLSAQGNVHQGRQSREERYYRKARCHECAGAR